VDDEGEGSIMILSVSQVFGHRDTSVLDGGQSAEMES